MKHNLKLSASPCSPAVCLLCDIKDPEESHSAGLNLQPMVQISRKLSCQQKSINNIDRCFVLLRNYSKGLKFIIYTYIYIYIYIFYIYTILYKKRVDLCIFCQVVVRKLRFPFSLKLYVTQESCKLMEPFLN